ncbi:MAG: SurA N-terminal domain-containing protein [Bacteroidales bacterium]
MSALEQIRNRAGLLVGVIGLALFAFIIGDFLNSGSTFFRSAQDKVVVVNGTKITTDEFNARVQELTEVYQIQMGQQNLGEDYQRQINQAIFEGIVRENIMGAEFKKLGITVSKDELADLLQGNNISPMIQQIPIFRNPQTGEFDRTILINFLKTINDSDLSKYGEEGAAQIADLKKYWLFWEKTVAEQRLEEKYNTLLSKAMVANSVSAKFAYDNEKVNADFAYTVKSYSSIPDSAVSVSNSDYKKAYDKYKERFKQDESRSVKYLAVAITPSEQDFADVNKRMQEIHDELLDSSSAAEIVRENSDVPFIDAYIAVRSLPAATQSFVSAAKVGEVSSINMEGNTYSVSKLIDRKMAADSMKVRHIMLAGEATQVATLADSLRNALSKGANFSEMAAKFSVDEAGQSGGELGWMTEATALQMAGDEFTKAASNASIGQTVVAKTLYGTHLIQVTERTRPVEKVKLAVVEMAVTPSSRTSSNIYNSLNEYIAVNRTIESFEKNAIEKGYNILSNTSLNGSEYQLGTVRQARQAIRWAFNASKGEVSNIFECDNNFVVVALDGIVSKGYTPMETVKPYLQAEVINAKKAEKIMADLKGKSAASLQDYAQAMGGRIDTAKLVNFNTRRITGIGEEPKLVALAPATEVGKTTSPIEGKNGVYVINVINKTDSEKAFDVNAEKQALQANNSYRMMYQTFNVLRSKADVEDFRIKFY